MDIGIAFDLKQEFTTVESEPEDRLEEYDSEATVDAIAHALASHGHKPRKLGGGRSFIERVLANPPQLVFNIAEGYGTRSREAHVPSVLEMLQIPYTHSDPLSLALTLDKGMAKRLISASALSTPQFTIVEHLDQATVANLQFPVIAKPLFEGSSMGIRKSSRLTDKEALMGHIDRLLQDYKQPVLLEEFCPGPEFTVGVMGNGASVHPMGVMEIVPRCSTMEEFVYSLEVKRNYLEEVEYHVPPRRSEALLRQIEELAVECYRTLECRDIARVDIRLDADNRPKFLEVNPLPGLNPITGDIVILSQRVGLSYDALIGKIVDIACQRYGIK